MIFVCGMSTWIMNDKIRGAHDAALQIIDTSIVCVFQHGACINRNRRQSMRRSRGGLISKIHAVSVGNLIRLAREAESRNASVL